MKTVKRFDVRSVAKTMAILYGCFALIFVPFILLMSLGVFASGQKEAGFAMGVGGIVIAIVAPFIYAGMAFVMGAFLAWLYNMIASKFGGIQVEIE